MKNDIKIKVCGLRDVSNITEVLALGVDYVGFIFYSRSPRYVGVDPDLAAIGGTAARVGVFVNEPQSSIIDKVQRHELSMVQLHGDETPSDCARIRDTGVLVTKVFSVDESFDFGRTIEYESAVDYFLFDTKGTYRGGNARAFDWGLLRAYNDRLPFFLSGGINEDNLYGINALLDKNLHAVDLNSGVEIAPALKDTRRISRIQQLLTQLV